MELQEYTIDIPQDLTANILAFKESIPEGNHCSNRGGWQIDYQDAPPEWIQSTYQAVKDILPEYTVKRAWINVNGPGHSNRWHRHHVDQYAAVLYVQVPENSGKMEFRVDHVYYPIQPVAGKFYVFSSNYMHCVHENKSTDNRISLAFNLIKR
jgi:aspartyl/asparaginyl beta-hydroxylase (cupin superfamily)